MSDNQPDGWNDLLAELGVPDAVPAAPATPAASTSPPPVISSFAAPKKTAKAPPAQPGNWNALASELGLAPAAEESVSSEPVPIAPTPTAEIVRAVRSEEGESGSSAPRDSRRDSGRRGDREPRRDRGSSHSGSRHSGPPSRSRFEESSELDDIDLSELATPVPGVELSSPAESEPESESASTPSGDREHKRGRRRRGRRGDRESRGDMIQPIKREPVSEIEVEPPTVAEPPQVTSAGLWDDDLPVPPTRSNEYDIFSLIDEKLGGPPQLPRAELIEGDSAIADEVGFERSSSEEETPSEEGGRKRRRRRRRRGKHGRSSEGTTERAPRVERDGEDLTAAEFDEDARPSERTADDESTSGGRRRRRRRTRKGESGRSRSDEKSHSRERIEDDPMTEDEEASYRAMQRDVTPWKEAISFLIQINMEARSKSGRGNGERGQRGGRDQGRGRERSRDRGDRTDRSRRDSNREQSDRTPRESDDRPRDY